MWLIRDYLKKELHGSFFVVLFVAVVMILTVSAYTLNKTDISYNENDLIRKYQFQKLENFKENIDTIIVGDSSAGNAINAEVLSELSEQTVLNLSLKGSHGIVGSLNMAKQALRLHPEIKNIVLIQTFDIWSRPFSRQGFFETSNNIDTRDIGKHFFPTYKAVDKLRLQTNILELYMLAKYLYKGPPELVIDHDNVYTKKERGTYKNGGLIMLGDEKMSKAIDPLKKQVYQTFDSFCDKQELNCVFIHGPIHNVLYKNTSEEFFQKINDIVSKSQFIVSIMTVFAIENENMGSSDDHVDISYKDEMTRRYYEELKPFLK